MVHKDYSQHQTFPYSLSYLFSPSCFLVCSHLQHHYQSHTSLWFILPNDHSCSPNDNALASVPSPPIVNMRNIFLTTCFLQLSPTWSLAHSDQVSSLFLLQYTRPFLQTSTCLVLGYLLPSLAPKTNFRIRIMNNFESPLKNK